jgi:divalent metal cation (Fe/Co/Zn/Cd) transporter
MPAMAAAFAALKPSELSDATPQMNILQRLGGSIGTAVLAVVLQRALIDAHHPLTAEGAAGAFSVAFWWSLGITALAIVPSIILLLAEREVRAKTRSATLTAEAPAVEPVGA